MENKKGIGGYIIKDLFVTLIMFNGQNCRITGYQNYKTVKQTTFNAITLKSQGGGGWMIKTKTNKKIIQKQTIYGPIVQYKYTVPTTIFENSSSCTPFSTFFKRFFIGFFSDHPVLK